MKKVLLILSFAAVAAAGGAAAQNIVLGDRVPELKISKWLDDNQPEAAPATYIEFFHASNPACIASLKRLKEITDKTGAKLRVIVVTKRTPRKSRRCSGPISRSGSARPSARKRRSPPSA